MINKFSLTWWISELSKRKIDNPSCKCEEGTWSPIKGDFNGKPINKLEIFTNGDDIIIDVGEFKLNIDIAKYFFWLKCFKDNCGKLKIWRQLLNLQLLDSILI